MDNNSNTQPDLLLQEIAQEQPGFTYDRDSIAVEVTATAMLLKRVPIKVFTILGGLLGMGTFMGFMVLVGMNTPGAGILFLIFGLCLLGTAELLIRSNREALAASFGISLYITGYVLLAFGVGQLTDSSTGAALALACAAAVAIAVSVSAIGVFIAVLVLNGSLLSLIFSHEVYPLTHGLIALLALVLAFLSLNEARLIAASRRFALVLGPVRMGVIFSLVMTLALFVHQKFFSTTITYFWVSSLILIACLLLLVYRVLRDVAILSPKAKLLIYTCAVLLLAPFILTPSVPGALLILLASFYIGHKPGFWVGLLALAYFIILYYYDLNMTLLAKSGVLVASGLLFLGGFILLNNYLKRHVD
ncbi:DUF4401 domain-containing protein [Pontibacter chinhatensis]|uniref:DUF4401 domain-containing protein n=1 Tax=Pontibacter chinhatensis TaxID=1436961 RepID=A0A1I2UMU5_9BACT|nr:DUF4401 domain-containing protein [Pontibacter chinhatensis]SFG76967.1 protein of unknown function [Pontibacter chinhatensis]